MYAQLDDEVLLQLRSPTIVCRGHAELESFPGKGNNGIVGVHLVVDHVERDRYRFFLRLLFRGRSRRRSGCLPRHRNDFHGAALARLSCRDDQLLRQNGDPLTSLGQNVLHHPRHGHRASDLKEVPTVTSQLGRLIEAFHHARSGRLCQEEHAMQLRGHGDGDLAGGIVQKGVVGDGWLEAKQLVTLLDRWSFRGCW